MAHGALLPVDRSTSATQRQAADGSSGRVWPGRPGPPATAVVFAAFGARLPLAALSSPMMTRLVTLRLIDDLAANTSTSCFGVYAVIGFGRHTVSSSLVSFLWVLQCASTESEVHTNVKHAYMLLCVVLFRFPHFLPTHLSKKLRVCLDSKFLH